MAKAIGTFKRELEISGASLVLLLCRAQSLQSWATGKKYFVCRKMLSISSNINVENL